MEQKSIFIIENYEQLKVISDPLRTEMLIFLVEQPHTGQMLAQELNLSRAKILYHLRELEKHKIIQLVRKEERGGNVLKFYQAVARGFIPATGIAAMNTTIVRIIQKTNASGRKRCTSFTHPFVNFLNITFSPFKSTQH